MVEVLISSSVLILVLAFLRLALRNRISARLQYALWLLVLVRLLVPVSFFHSPVSVAEAAKPVTEQAEKISQTDVSTGPISQLTANRFMRFGIFPDESEPTFDLETPMIWSWSMKTVALFVWRVGIVVMAVCFLFVNARLALRLKKNRTPYDAAAKLPVYIASGLLSPCLFGLFNPVIYLTERAAEDDAQARQIITHELTHYRHGDMIWLLLRSACLVVWWFNPLVWLAAALSRQDCELACDEGTIKALGEEERFDYGRTLVGMAKVGTTPSDLSAARRP